MPDYTHHKLQEYDPEDDRQPPEVEAGLDVQHQKGQAREHKGNGGNVEGLEGLLTHKAELHLDHVASPGEQHAVEERPEGLFEGALLTEVQGQYGCSKAQRQYQLVVDVFPVSNGIVVDAPDHIDHSEHSTSNHKCQCLIVVGSKNMGGIPYGVRDKDIDGCKDGIEGQAFIDWVYQSQLEETGTVLSPHRAEIYDHDDAED